MKKKGILWLLLGGGVGAGIVWWFCCRDKDMVPRPIEYMPPPAPAEEPTVEVLLAQASPATMRTAAPRSPTMQKAAYILE